MLKPNQAVELAEMIKAADGPVAIHGGGTRGISVAGNAITTAGISGITLHEPGALTLVAKTGTTLADVDAALDAEGQRLAFEPMDLRGLLGTTGEPTIGGVVASNTSGPRRIQAGACRDFLLGVEFVDGSGTVLKNGGRVMKNVTGYDLVKLMAGSYGTLGILTEVSLKVMPKPEVVGTLILRGLSDQDAQRAMSIALGSPFDVTGAAHVPQGIGDTAVTLIRVEGFDGSVNYRAGQLQGLLHDYGESEIITDTEKSGSYWKTVRDVEPFHAQTGDVWRISCKPSDGPKIAAALEGAQTVFDWGGGLLWGLVAEGNDIRPSLEGFGGHATLIRASAETREKIQRFQPEQPGVAALTSGLRAKFDPRGILNAGLMG